MDELSQLYLNVGEREKALSLAESAPDIWGTREFLRIYACDGKEQAKAYGAALLATIHSCAALMIQCVLAFDRNMTNAEKIRSIRDAIALFGCVCTDGNYGDHNGYIAKMYMLLSVYLWLESLQDEAFAALERALLHCRKYAVFCEQEEPAFTAPLVRLVKGRPSSEGEDLAEAKRLAARLPEDWPWWNVPEEEQVRKEMQADPRWAAWVAQTQA